MKINGEAITVPGMPEEVLRGMNHREWLVQFSETLLTQYRRPDGTTVPMTPFRIGAINRLKMAASYIALLEADLRKSREEKKHDARTAPEDP